MKIDSHTNVNRIRTIKLDNEDIINMLREKGIIADNETIKEVFVRVPGGGDYSNMNLDINDEECVQVILHSNPEFPLEESRDDYNPLD